MRTFHKTLGLFMLLPFIAWAVTGIFFFFKPGYQEAYQSLSVKLYPLKHHIPMPQTSTTHWLAIKQYRTILGDHLLIQNEQGWQQLNPINFEVIPSIPVEQVKLLVNDAIKENPDRYGEIVAIDKFKITTSTDVNITLNWPQLTLRQQGKDTDLINTIYDIHYLRWTGIKALDRVLGVVGLLLVVLLAGIGTYLTFTKSNPKA
ncbi:PepSY domain-containing protein [Thalassotalea piscium]